MDNGERIIKYRKDDLQDIKNLYESVMTVASHGLFFRTGKIVGNRIVAMAANGGDFKENVRKVIIEEGWVTDIEFNGASIKVKGSIEVDTGKPDMNCHILRGVLTVVSEQDNGGKIYCHELECQSHGAEHCVFKVDSEVL